jgi:16S rRNA (uracil1498-N3)-methyltransferase
MSRRRFFVPEVRRNQAELTGPEAEHLVRVLRAEAGQVYEVSDNLNLYLAEIAVARKSMVTFNILEQLPVPEASVTIFLLPALFKFDRFEWMIEKATELGVSGIQPWQAVRSERGLAQASLKRISRWQKIAHEASQQARRAHLPSIEPSVSLVEALRVDAGLKLLLDEDPTAPGLRHRLPPERRPGDSIALLSGPEGGWTTQERAQALDSGWQAVSLGQTILRAETAAIAGVAAIQAAWQ